MSKFGLLGMTGDVEGGSLASQVLWGLVYVTCGWRLVTLRPSFGAVVQRSLPLISFLALTLLSYLWSVDPWVTLRNAIEMIGTTLVCYLAVVRFTMREFLRILVRYFGFVIVVSLGLVFLWPSHGRSSYGVVGWCGLFSEKNGFGAVAGLSVLTFASAILLESGRRRSVLAVGLLLSAIALLGSQAITAALVTFAAVAVVGSSLLFSSPRYGIYSRIALPIAIMVIGIVILGTGADSTTFFSLVGKNSSLTGRADFWPGVIRAIGDRPFLGFGYNAFFYTQSTVDEYIAGLTGWWIPLNAHNSYYQMILSVGLVGIAIFALAVFRALGVSLIRVLSGRDATLTWPLAIIVFEVLGSFTEAYVGIPNSVGSMCFLVALLYPLRTAEAPETTLRADVSLKRSARPLRPPTIQRLRSR